MKKNNFMKTLTNRTFCQNKGRNLVAVLAVFFNYSDVYYFICARSKYQRKHNNHEFSSVRV